MEKYGAIIFILFLSTFSGVNAHNARSFYEKPTLTPQEVLEDHTAWEQIEKSKRRKDGSQKKDTDDLFKKIELAIKTLCLLVDYTKIAHATGYPLECTAGIVGLAGSSYLLHAKSQWHTINNGAILTGLGNNAVPLAIVAATFIGCAYGTNKLKKYLFGESTKKEIVLEIDSPSPNTVTIRHKGISL